MAEIVPPSKEEVSDEGSFAFGGTFMCHTCDEPVYEAHYVTSKQRLWWDCENGHHSEIDYVIG